MTFCVSIVADGGIVFGADTFAIASHEQNGQSMYAATMAGAVKLRQVGHYGVLFWGRSNDGGGPSTIELLSRFERTHAAESVGQLAQEFATFAVSRIADPGNLNFLVGGCEDGPRLAGHSPGKPRPHGYAMVELFGYTDGVDRLFPEGYPASWEGMPIKDAIDLASYLVNVQAGYTRFWGIGRQIVGGEVEIAVMREGRFEWVRRSRWAP